AGRCINGAVQPFRRLMLPPKLKTGFASAQTSTQEREKLDVGASDAHFGSRRTFRAMSMISASCQIADLATIDLLNSKFNSISTWSFEPLSGVRGRPSRHAAAD